MSPIESGAEEGHHRAARRPRDVERATGPAQDTGATQGILAGLERDLFDVIIEHAQVQLAYLDDGYDFVRVNPAFARRAGTAPRDLVGQNYFDTFPDDDSRAIFSRARDSGATITLQARPFRPLSQPDADTTYWDWSIVPLRANDGKHQGFVVSLLDVTAREQERRRLQTVAEDLRGEVRRQTAALQDSETYLRAIFDRAALGIGIADKTWCLVDSNPALQQMLGYTAEELQGMPVAHFTHADDMEETVILSSGLIQGRRETYQTEKRYIRKDGKIIWVRLNVSHLPHNWHAQHFAIGLAEDITERKVAQAALLRAERLALTGRLAAGLAHEINNPLQGVIGFLALAQESLAQGDSADDLLATAARELDRAANIVSQMMHVNRPWPVVERGPCDIVEQIAAVLRLTEKQRRDHGISLRWDAEADTLAITAAADQIEQVFLNLVLNALEAMSAGGHLEITARRTERPDGVLVRIADSGGGVPPGVRTHLFEPFHTTKEHGLGLGLYVTQNIVRAHGGRIELQNRGGEGATFSVWLPREPHDAVQE